MKAKSQLLHIALGALALVVLPVTVMAADPSGDIATQDFQVRRAQIESDLAGGEKYSEITDAQRQDVRNALAIIADKLGDKASTAELATNDRAEVLQAQQKLNTVLADAAKESRVVCTRVQAVGSHLSTNKCMTVAARRRASEENASTLNRSLKGGTKAGGF